MEPIEIKAFLSKICKVRRNLNMFSQSRKVVEEFEITRVEIGAAIYPEKVKDWLEKNVDLVVKVCPQRFYPQLNKILLTINQKPIKL